MRVLAAILTVLLSAASPAAATAATGDADAGPTWYLALGDSLAAGWQPNGEPDRDHMTDAGYVDQLWLLARRHYPDLQLHDLACPGESTASIRIDNGRCAYPHGSQLAEALAFIEAHHDALAFITIDIGFGDFECTDALACLFPGIEGIEARLPGVLAELRAAAPDVPIVGMNIYDPYLALWLDGDVTLARQSVVAIELINEALEEAYADAGMPVADVASAFAINDWSTTVPMAGRGDVPRNVALLCERTWLCQPPPNGPDRHPNVLGFRAMAEAFARELGIASVA